MQSIADQLLGRGITLVDCPISGVSKGVRASTQSVITLGPEAALAQMRPWLGRIGKSVFMVGSTAGRAQLMKLVNNPTSAANLATTFEVLVLGAKGGLDPDLMVLVVDVSAGRNGATLDKVPRAVLLSTFHYAVKLSTMYKNVTLGLNEAHAFGVPKWTRETVAQL